MRGTLQPLESGSNLFDFHGIPSTVTLCAKARTNSSAFVHYTPAARESRARHDGTQLGEYRLRRKVLVRAYHRFGLEQWVVERNETLGKKGEERRGGSALLLEQGTM